MPDVRRALGAGPASGTTQVTLFIPSLDRDGQPVDQVAWRDEALAVLGRLFRGATAFPPGRGVWRDDDCAGKLLYEDIVLVTSYVPTRALTNATLADLRAFLHRLGRETRQGEVGVVVGDKYPAINDYDAPASPSR